MAQRPKRILAVNDLTGYGRCALTTVLPVLAHMGYQLCPLPTALLSTHPGGFEGFYYQDLSEATAPILAHWAKEGIVFDGVYTGFFASVRAMEALGEWPAFGGALRIVDPVMGDHGKPYRFCAPDMVAAMRALVRGADAITPNCTEAALLLGREFQETPPLPETLRALLALGCGCVALTGVELGEGRAANALMVEGDEGYWLCEYTPVPAQYPGTGDLFASVFTGALLRGAAPEVALGEATAFACRVVEYTHGLRTPVREGVVFEPLLGGLGERFPARYITENSRRMDR